MCLIKTGDLPNSMDYVIDSSYRACKGQNNDFKPETCFVAVFQILFLHKALTTFC